MKKITLISGANSSSSRLNGVIAYVQSYFNPQVQFNMIHVRQLSADALITADFNDPSILEANKRVEESDGVIVATPTYKAAYSGILKTYLDLLPQHVLNQKAVLPLAIGGSPAHVLVIKYALEPVLSELGARHIVQGVYTIDRQIKRRENGGFELDTDASGRLARALSQFEESLAGLGTQTIVSH